MSLRHLLDEAIGQTPPSAVDVDRVIRRQRRAAVLRPVLAAASAAVLAIGALSVLAIDGDPAAPPVEPGRYFPQYVDGLRVIAEASAPLTERELGLEFVPQTTDGLAILIRCDPVGADAAFDLELKLGAGTQFLDDRCGEEILRPPGRWPAWAQAGEPSRIELRITGGRSYDDPPTGGTFGLAVAEPVPFQDYPFPPRPSVLPPLDPDLARPSADAQVLRADPTDPDRPQELTVVWGIALEIGARAQAPGEWDVYLNGERVPPQNGPLAVWDYQQAEVRRNIQAEHQPGEEVTVTVVPRHMTGDWIMVLDPFPPPEE